MPELAQIVRLGLKDVNVSDELLLDVSTVLRGNARAGQKLASDILSYLKGGKTFDKSDWEKLKGILSIRPLGLNPIEIQVLRYLTQSYTGTSLTCMSAKTGMTRAALQQDSEMFLLKNGLMEVTTTGRIITAKGLEYLKQLDGSATSIAAPVCATV